MEQDFSSYIYTITHSQESPRHTAHTVGFGTTQEQTDTERRAPGGWGGVGCAMRTLSQVL